MEIKVNCTVVRNLREGHLHSIYTIYTIVYIIYTVLFPESDDIGGNQGKLYCGKELEGRTLKQYLHHIHYCLHH